jgi:hypothetical protein
MRLANLGSSLPSQIRDIQLWICMDFKHSHAIGLLVHISVSGYGKSKNDIMSVVPNQ